MNESQRARAKFFQSAKFRRLCADDFGLGGLSAEIASRIDILLQGRRLPSSSGDNTSALAMDGAIIVASIGSIRANSTAVLSATDRLCAMKLVSAVGSNSTLERTVPSVPEGEASNFATALALQIREYWAAPERAFVQGLCHTAIFVPWSIKGDEVLVGTLNLVSARRTLTYSTNPTSAGERIESNPTGGVTLMPAALANLAETLANGATGGAAAIRAGTRWP